MEQITEGRMGKRTPQIALDAQTAKGVSWNGDAINVTEYETEDRKSTRLNSSHGYISYAVFL